MSIVDDREPALITALVLADDDPDATEITERSLAGLVDDTVVVNRRELDWTDTEAARRLIDALVDDWIIVLAAGERLRTTSREALRSTLLDADDDAIAVHVGLAAEVRIHRRGPAAMAVIGSTGGEPSRVVAIAAPDTTSDEPAVSVIVPTFNRPHLLRRCLEGLAVQTTTDLEVIVVNDGGLDVAPIIVDFEDRLSVKLITQPHNEGAAAAANAGLALARGRYAHFQADDDTVHPNHIRLLVTALDEAASSGLAAGVVFGPAVMVEEDESGMVAHSTVAFRGPHDPEELLWRNFIVGGTAMFDRDLAVSIGGMNTDYEVLEDWDFWLRMAAEADIHYVDVPTAEYRMRPGTANGTTQARPRFYRSLLRLYEDHPCEPGSLAEAERHRQVEAQAISHGDAFAWEHTVAIIGTGDLAALVTTLGSVVAHADRSSLQVIVHDLRTDEAEALLKELAGDATVCLHAFVDEERCRARIDRQAGGRTVSVLRAGEIFERPGGE